MRSISRTCVRLLFRSGTGETLWVGNAFLPMHVRIILFLTLKNIPMWKIIPGYSVRMQREESKSEESRGAMYLFRDQFVVFGFMLAKLANVAKTGISFSFCFMGFGCRLSLR